MLQPEAIAEIRKIPSVVVGGRRCVALTVRERDVLLADRDELVRRLAKAEAAMAAAHNALVEWYVQDQADVIGVVGAINAAHRMVEAVKLIDAWLGRCAAPMEETT